jgi:hypothetical protein
MTAKPGAPVTSESLRADLERAIRFRYICVDPAGAADLAMGVVLPHLRAMAGEIKRLRDESEGLRLARSMHVCGQVKSGSEGEERRA